MPLTEEQKKRLRELQAEARQSRLAPSSTSAPAVDEQVAAPERGNVSRLFGVLTSGEEFLGALGIDHENLSPGFLPDIVEKGIDTAVDWTVNPVGIASLAFAPALPAARLSRFVSPAIRGSRLGQSVVGRGAGQIATRVAGDTAVGAAATGAGRVANEVLPEDMNPLVRGALTLGAGFAGGAAAGSVIQRAIPKTAAEIASRRASTLRVADNNGVVKADRIILDIPSVARNMGEVETVGRVGRALNKVTSANPSANFSDDLHRITTGYDRAKIQATNQINAILGGAFPKGLRSFNVADDGTMIVNNTRQQWHEAVKNPAALTPDQQHELGQLRKVIDDAVEIAENHGFTVPDELKQLDYIPRQVLSKKGVEFKARSNPFEQRLWKNTNEAAEAGITYANPAETVRTFLQTVFDLSLQKQVEDQLDLLSVTPSVAVLATKQGRMQFDHWQRAVTDVAEKKAEVARATEAIADSLRAGAVNSTAYDRLLKAQKELREAREIATKRKQSWGKVRDSIVDNLRKGTVQLTDGTLPTPALEAKHGARVRKLANKPVTIQGNRVFENDDALKRYRQWLIEHNVAPKNPDPRLHAFAEASNLARTASATLDFAMPFVQGLPLLFRNPTQWGRMAYGHYVATFRPGYQARYIRENLADIQEMVTRGSVPIGDVEFFTSLQHGLTKQALDLPVVRNTLKPTFNAFQRGYDTGLLIMRAEMWKAMRGQMDDKALGQFIRNSTGGLDTKALGVSATRRDAESLIFFAPKLLRSSLALVGDGMRPWNPEGAEAAQTLMRMMAGGAGLFAIANVAQGLNENESEAEIHERLRQSLDPTNGRQFLALQVGDRWYGIGGQIRSISQMLARTVVGIEEGVKEGKLFEAEFSNNPLATFIQSRTSPGVRFAAAGFEKLTDEKLNVLPYETIDDWPDLAQIAGTSFLPFAIQGMIEEGGLSPNLALDMAGLNPKPLSPVDVLNQRARETYGLAWKDLTDEEQAVIKDREPNLVAEGERFGSRSEREWRATSTAIDERTRVSLVGLNEALQTGRLTPDDFRGRVEEVMRDRWVSQSQAREDFGVEFGPANTAKRLVTDAYFQTFTEAEIVPGQTDWTRWDELQAALQNRIAAGEFGNPSRAQEFLDERKKFQYPPELQWYADAKDTIDNYNYWGVRDEVFDRFTDTVNSLMPEVTDVSQLDIAAISSDPITAARAKALLKIIDNEVSRRRTILRLQHSDLQEALRLTGRVTSRPKL